jgi:hypothetical protein
MLQGVHRAVDSINDVKYINTSIAFTATTLTRQEEFGGIL